MFNGLPLEARRRAFAQRRLIFFFLLSTFAIKQRVVFAWERLVDNINRGRREREGKKNKINI